MDKFGTVLTCMDGRIQSQVQEYIKNVYKVDFVDTITLAGPVQVISNNSHKKVIDNLKYRTDISVNLHKSGIIGVVGHHDCAAISCCDTDQKKHILSAVESVTTWYPQCKVIAIWINEKFELELL